MRAGILYIKKEKVTNIWPLFGESAFTDGNIRQLNHTGAHPVHTDLAIANAIEYYQRLDKKRKETRLRYLQQYWTSQVRDFPRIIINTPDDSQRHGAIGNVGVEGITPQALVKTLMDNHRIWTVAIDRPSVKGVSITPNVYTTTKELDSFVKALKAIASA